MQQIQSKNNFIDEKTVNYFQEDQKNIQDKYFQDKSIIKVSDDISQITMQKNSNNDEKIQNLLDQNTYLLNKLQQLQKESQKLISQNLQNMKITLNDLIQQNMQIKQESEDIQDQNQDLMFQYENEKSQQEQNIRQEKSKILELKQKNAEFLIQVVQNYSQNLSQMKNSNLRDLINAIGKKQSVSKFSDSFYRSEVPNNTLQNLIKNVKCSNYKQTMDSFYSSTNMNNKQVKTNQFDHNLTRNKFLIQKQKSSSLMKFQKLNTIS